jgi:glucans biosynthesis protein
MSFKPDRRDVLAGALAGTALGWTAPALGASPVGAIALGPPQPFSFERLKQRARALARTAYAPPKSADADVLHAVDYDAFGQAAYRPQMELWPGGPQPVRLFPQGRYFTEPVAIHVLEGGAARQALYSPDLFDMPADHPLRRLKAGGFAGFRLMSRGGQSDWLAYLGASYFRASEPLDQYGLSARGLAINSGGPAPEEFPRFTAFWLEQDGSGGLVVYALMEGRSVVGAYRMDNRRGPGGAAQEVQMELYFRAPVETLGIAPLTSMYWYGENSTGPRQDWRPEVHDSDGLALWTGAGERLWRPLADPPRIVTNSYVDQSPRGFGLIQRDRNFEDYQDDGIFYDKRPSLWIEPVGDWGRGAVKLVQLPTQGETEDNIVAFWTPEARVGAGSVIAAGYRMRWTLDAPDAGGGRIVSTRVGAGGRPGQPPAPGSRKYVIDVEGKALEGLTRSSGVEAAVAASRGRIDNVQAYPVVGARRWRMMFDLSGLDGQPADLRAYLRKGGQALSETWIYQAFP